MKVILFEVVDRNGRPLAGATVSCYVDEKKIATLTYGDLAGLIEVPKDARVKLIAEYGPFTQEGTPSAQNMCRIQFDDLRLDEMPPDWLEVSGLPIDARSRWVGAAPEIKEGLPVLNLIVVVVCFLGFCFIGAGVWLAFLKETGDAVIDILGMKMTTQSAGLGSIFIGAAVIISVLRRVLKTIVDLGRI